MGIFKESLKKGIRKQLEVRTNVVKGNHSNYNRNPNLPFYLSKNSWVRMSSMVNYTSGKVVYNGKGKVSTKSDNHWTGQELSQRYILEGGTLYTKNNNGNDIEAALRKNVATVDGAYGGDFDVRGDGSVDPRYTRQFGIRPMPGITGVNLHTIGAYGSIFETTIKFYAWDSKQLSDLEILFMRPGYNVLLEWGWSQYITNSGNTEVWPGLSLDPFQKQTQQEIYDKLQTFREKYDYNYDGMLGYVKNFNWNLMPNGGYECSTTLISMGEVINSLKISTNNIQKPLKPNFNLNRGEKPVYDDWEKILISLKASAEGITSSGSIKTISDEENYFGKWNYDEDYIQRSEIKTQLEKHNFDSASVRLGDQPFVKQIKTGNNSKPEGDYYEYLSLDVIMAMMDSYFNFSIGKNSTEKIVKIIPPGNEDYCLAGRDSISVDPSVCIVGNRYAFEKEFTLGLNPITIPGVVIPLQQTEAKNGKLTKSENFFYTGDFYNDTLKVGLIGNIYVNISLLLDTYKQQKNTANDDGVNFVSYMKSILNKISNSLGGLNNFILSTAGRDQNTLRIVDTYYLEKDGDDKYELDIMGLGSICRETNIISEIFPEQSTMIAIAAQSRANLGDIYNSSFSYLNVGLENRLSPIIEQPNEIDGRNQFFQNLLDLLLYVRDYVVGDPNEKFAIQTQNNGNIPTTFLKQFMLRYNGEINFKALIPFKLSIKLDGISGITIGQIFKIKGDILPRNYYDKGLDFIITNISHNLQDNDWETTLETQICILDNFAKGKELINVDRKGFGDFIAKAKKQSLIYPALVHFIEFQALKTILISSVKQYRAENAVSSLTFAIEELLQNPTKLKNNIESGLELRSNGIVTGAQGYDITKYTQPYSIDQFAGFFQKWVELFVNFSPSNILNIQLNEGGQTLKEAYEELVKEPSYSETLLPLSNDINNNIDMFYDKGLWTNAIVSVFNSTPSGFHIDYNQLWNNISFLLTSRDIISKNDVRIYNEFSLNNGEIIANISPIEDSVIFNGIDAQSQVSGGSLYQRFNINKYNIERRNKLLIPSQTTKAEIGKNKIIIDNNSLIKDYYIRTIDAMELNNVNLDEYLKNGGIII